MSLKIEEHTPLAPHTTLHVGGVAAFFHLLTDEKDLAVVVRFAHERGLPVWVLGGGSNVLIADGVINRLVIKNELKGITYTTLVSGEVEVEVAAGESWDAFVADTVLRGLYGLENLSGIPGTVGAAPIQNINAYGVEVASTVTAVRVYDINTGEEKTLTKDICCFGYRDSIFKHGDARAYVVLSVTFCLKTAPTIQHEYRSASQSIAAYLTEQGIEVPTSVDIRRAVLHVRSNIGMLEGQYRSAGSFFKNTIIDGEMFARVHAVVAKNFPEKDTQFSPWFWNLSDGTVKVSTAFLLECSPYNKTTFGTKRINGVGFSPKHSLSIVTEGGATADAVKEFVTTVIDAVKNIFSLEIETEVVMID